jgi:hypothetical protein
MSSGRGEVPNQGLLSGHVARTTNHELNSVVLTNSQDWMGPAVFHGKVKLVNSAHKQDWRLQVNCEGSGRQILCLLLSYHLLFH